MNVESFPRLGRLLRAYLNAEYIEEYGTLEAAVDAYVQDIGARGAGDLGREIDGLLERSHAAASLRSDLERFGLEFDIERCGYDPAGFLQMIRSRGRA